MIKAVTIYKKIGRLRQVIRAEGSPEVQDAWDALEPHVYVFMNGGVQDGACGENAKDRGGPSDVGQP